jgi:hypothetical protein
VLDTSLPNRLSTGPRFPVHPNRQRSDNGATGCVNHSAMAQPSFAKQRLPTPFLSLHRNPSLMRSRNVSRVSSDIGTRTASLRCSEEVLTSIVKKSGKIISFPRTTMVPRIFPSSIISRSTRLLRVGFPDSGGSQFNLAKESCCWKSREPQISIFHGAEISTMTTRNLCRSVPGISDSSATLSSTAFPGRDLLRLSGSFGIFLPTASPDQKTR